MSVVNVELGAFGDNIHNPEVAELNSRTQQIDINSVPYNDLVEANPKDPRLADYDAENLFMHNSCRLYYISGILDVVPEVLSDGTGNESDVATTLSVATEDGYVTVNITNAPLASVNPYALILIDGHEYTLGKLGVVVDSKGEVTYDDTKTVTLNAINKAPRITINWGDGKVECFKFPQRA